MGFTYDCVGFLMHSNNIIPAEKGTKKAQCLAQFKKIHQMTGQVGKSELTSSSQWRAGIRICIRTITVAMLTTCSCILLY